MGLIRDIRLFEADWPNEDYFSTPYYIGRIFHMDAMDVLDVKERLVFLLRARGFEFDGFDHLYLNFTTMLPPGQIRQAKRTVFREDGWLRWVDVGCDAEAFNSWELDKKTEHIVAAIAQAVLHMAPSESREAVRGCITEVLEQGEKLAIPYRQKGNEMYTVDVLVRITDEPDYIPLLRIAQKDGAIVCQQELGPFDRDAFICQFSSFSIGKRSLRIIPRKNYESEYYGLKPIKITW